MTDLTTETDPPLITAANDVPASESELAGFEWCVVEIFGHRSHAGRAREEERFGSKMMRVDALILDAEGKDIWQTFYYSGGSLFSYQPTTEAIVRQRAPREYAPRRAALAAPAPGEDITNYDDDDGGEFED